MYLSGYSKSHSCPCHHQGTPGADHRGAVEGSIKYLSSPFPHSLCEQIAKRGMLTADLNPLFSVTPETGIRNLSSGNNVHSSHHTSCAPTRGEPPRAGFSKSINYRKPIIFLPLTCKCGIAPARGEGASSPCDS